MSCRSSGTPCWKCCASRWKIRSSPSAAPRAGSPFPSSFMLVGAMNPCPCGYYGDPFHKCTCPPGLVSRYQRRISGPFIDRVDIFVEVPHIDYEKLTDNRLGETSEKVQARVTAARARQLKRFKGTQTDRNAEMTPTEIREFCHVEDAAQACSRRHETALPLRPRLPPHPETGAHHRRPGKQRHDQSPPCRRGHPVPAEKDGVKNPVKLTWRES